MNREDIILMAWEAGYLSLSPEQRGMELAELERLANAAYAAGAAAEREQCAKVCDGIADKNAKSATDEEYEVAVPRECAAAIRARGNGGAK